LGDTPKPPAGTSPCTLYIVVSLSTPLSKRDSRRLSACASGSRQHSAAPSWHGLVVGTNGNVSVRAETRPGYLLVWGTAFNSPAPVIGDGEERRGAKLLCTPRCVISVGAHNDAPGTLGLLVCLRGDTYPYHAAMVWNGWVGRASVLFQILHRVAERRSLGFGSATRH